MPTRSIQASSNAVTRSTRSWPLRYLICCAPSTARSSRKKTALRRRAGAPPTCISLTTTRPWPLSKARRAWPLPAMPSTSPPAALSSCSLTSRTEGSATRSGAPDRVAVNAANGLGELGRHLLCGQIRPVPGGIPLDAPAVRQRPGIDHVEADLVDESSDPLPGLGVIAGDHQGAPSRRIGGQALRPEVLPEDVVEGLHHVRLRQVLLQQAAGGCLVLVEGGDVAVASGVIVVGVHDDLARQLGHRDLRVIL